MRNIRDTFFGFIILSLTVAFNTTIGILVYTHVEDRKIIVIAAIMFVVIVASSLLFTGIDYIRRKIMIDRPLKEILKATKSMSKGNFSINLFPYHNLNRYDEFDYIIENLNIMAKELSKNEIFKNDFIANVSHEIKTPLSVIQNYATLLKDENLTNEEREKYIKQLNNACKRLTNLVTNILKLNKLENQKLNPSFKKFNLSELLANQIIQFEELIETKNIELSLDIQEDLYIVSEESYLELIFNNLISNAIKFTNQDGKIHISLNKEEEKYIIEFSDNGCGMNKETGQHIFDKFYQGDTSRSKEGNGLGLAIVKKVIDILGGNIKVKSEVNVGTTFIIEIKGE